MTGTNSEGEFLEPVEVEKPKGVPLAPLWKRTARVRKITTRLVLFALFVAASLFAGDRITGNSEYQAFVSNFDQEFASGEFQIMSDAPIISLGTGGSPVSWYEVEKVPNFNSLYLGERPLTYTPRRFFIDPQSQDCVSFKIPNEATGLSAVAEVEPNKVFILIPPLSTGTIRVCSLAEHTVAIAMWARQEPLIRGVITDENEPSS